MNISISKELAEAIGVKKLKPYGIDEDKFRWSSAEIGLQRVPKPKVIALRDMIAPHTSIKGTRSILKDLAVWIEAGEKGAGETTCKTTKQFASLVFEWMQKQPLHRLFWKDDERDVWRAYYVGCVEFHPKQIRDRIVIPAHTDLDLFYIELGVQKHAAIKFEDDDVAGRTVPQILHEAGYLPQTDELAETYKAYTDKYVAIYDKIGMQFLADGIGTTNLDGNSKSDRYWSWGYDKIKLERNGEPSRVVIDIFRESDKSSRDENDAKFSENFWRRRSYLDKESDEDEDDDPNVVNPEDVDGENDVPAPIEVPLFPVVPVFDLKKHTRIRVHVANLTEYVYDEKLGEKLVLPQECTSLVNMLVSNKTGFNDIIKGKGGGAIILCAGKPGTGKTLTAEVYAEVMKRPLYTVQCSQLGTDQDELEEELLKIFSRSQRWNAILLLDEADVYVAARGSDLQQNAIVGVFLRVLEYYGGVLFLTTNRADLVDDAIASRCIAKIDYQIPTVDDQARIWRILADTAGIELDQKVIIQIVAKHPKLTGRDVKNLLKLARLVSDQHKTPITAQMIDFVKRFKPTIDEEKPRPGMTSLPGTGS